MPDDTRHHESFQLPHYSQLLTAGDYTQLLHPTGITWGARAVIPIDNGILAVQHTHPDGGETFWVFPGGGLDPVETIPQAVVREAQEETGLTVSVDCLLHVRRPNFHNGLEFYVLAQAESYNYELGHDPEFAPDAQVLTDIAVLSFDRLEQDDDLVFYPVSLRKRLRQDIQNPPTRALYLGNAP